VPYRLPAPPVRACARAPRLAAVAAAAVLAAWSVAVAAVGGAEIPTGTIVFAESVPVETELGLPELPDAPAVWLDLVDGAERTIDVFTFYFSPNPDGVDHLQPVLAALEAKARGGVAVRLLSERKFHETYPETHDRLGQVPGIQARLFDGEALWGGILHAKGMILDDRRFFLGSQNWDWRALEHIHELGAVVADDSLTADLARIYALDWALAGGEAPPPVRASVPATPEWRRPRALLAPGEVPCAAVLAASPPQALPPGVPWDLPLLVDQIDRARERVRLQMLSYSPGDRDVAWWGDLDAALRRAAGRGCEVQLIFSNWAKRASSLAHIQSLALVPNVAVRFTNVPAWSGGFVPFARVEHAKYLTCDRDALWLGTSNGSRDYFFDSRNVSLFLRGEGCAAAADAFFERSWSSPYAEPVDPCGEYAPPRTR